MPPALEQIPERRLGVVRAVLLLAFLILAYGLWQLQILQQSHWQTLAQENRIRSEPIPAPRGRFLDRYGRLLVDNYPSFSVLLVRERGKHVRADLPGIAKGLGLAPADLAEQLRRFASAPPYQPVIIKEDITPNDLAFVDSHRDEYPELETMTISRRLYPSDGYAAHVIGYVGEATENDVERRHVAPGTLVGKSGLEQYYNNLLTGQDGLRRVIVDSRGRVEGEISAVPPTPGRDLRLTLDKTVQDAAEEALGQRSGAIVALDPKTGEVLAMVSRPTYNANEFTLGISSQQWQKLLDDPEHPLLNKAIQAQLAPGSIFKIIMSVAGLEQGVAQNLKVDCTGGATFYGRYYKCWVTDEHKPPHGITDLHKAIVQSCDVYFYTLGNMLGVDTIDKYADALGLGRPTGIDLPHEAAGLVPSPAWRERRFHQPWWRGLTINMAIGQGALEATPLQLARTIGGIASGGVFLRPHLVFPYETAGERYPDDKYPREFKFPIPPAAVSLITDAMRGVVGPAGTGASAHIQGVDWGGKTGTAQTVSVEHAKASHKRAFVDNVWFVGVYPVENPDIAVCVLFQHGAWSWYAANIAGQVIDAYYQEQQARAKTETARERRLAPGAGEFASSPGALAFRPAVWRPPQIPPPPARAAGGISFPERRP